MLSLVGTLLNHIPSVDLPETCRPPADSLGYRPTSLSLITAMPRRRPLDLDLMEVMAIHLQSRACTTSLTPPHTTEGRWPTGTPHHSRVASDRGKRALVLTSTCTDHICILVGGEVGVPRLWSHDCRMRAIVLIILGAPVCSRPLEILQVLVTKVSTGSLLGHIVSEILTRILVLARTTRVVESTRDCLCTGYYAVWGALCLLVLLYYRKLLRLLKFFRIIDLLLPVIILWLRLVLTWRKRSV